MQSDEKITTVVLETSRELEKILNEHLLLEFGKRHNIAPEQNKFFLKQEIVARGAYFLDVKKKYALHVTNMEGVPVDEMDVKGMITKRSDYPSLTKIKIQELLNMLVLPDKINRDDIDKFTDDVEKYIKELCTLGEKDIGRPVTYSKDDKDYKKVPTHIIGMKLWNICEYNIFVPGTKGYLFKINGIDWDSPYITEGAKRHQTMLMEQKLNYVVVPPEAPRLPKYFIIDVDFMVNFAWNDRVDEILKPIGGRRSKINKNIENNIFTF